MLLVLCDTVRIDCGTCLLYLVFVSSLWAKKGRREFPPTKNYFVPFKNDSQLTGILTDLIVASLEFLQQYDDEAS